MEIKLKGKTLNIKEKEEYSKEFESLYCNIKQKILETNFTKEDLEILTRMDEIILLLEVIQKQEARK